MVQCIQGSRRAARATGGGRRVMRGGVRRRALAWGAWGAASKAYVNSGGRWRRRCWTASQEHL